jgi:hypothetical protein
MCLFCILELTKRTLVIPKYDKSNCSYGSRYIKQLNACLQKLSAFGEPKTLAGIIDLSLERLLGSPGDRGVALVATLDAISELLSTVYKGCRSKLVSTRVTMSKESTVSLEAALLQHVPTLMRLLDIPSGRSESLQRLRLAIVEALRGLFMSKNAETLSQLVKHNVPSILFSLLSSMEWSSIMHCKITDCATLTFRDQREVPGMPFQELAVMWLKAMSQATPSLWDVLRAHRVVDGGSGSGDASHAYQRVVCVEDGLSPRGYFGVYIRIGLVLLDVVRSERGDEGTLRAAMESEGVFLTFLRTRMESLDAISVFQQGSLGGPRPQKTTASLLASAKTLATLSLDNMDNIPVAK